MEEAGDTLDVTAQKKVHGTNPKLAKNYGTNNRMLQYRHLDEYFYMDTFHATKKGGLSSRGKKVLSIICQ